MWKTGDRIKTVSPIHGEMYGTIDAVTAGTYQTIYHVTWETSKTGTIKSHELAGRDDLNWQLIQPISSADKAQPVRVRPSNTIEREVNQDTNLASPHTKRAYKTDLARFESWAEGAPLTRALVERYLADLEASGKSPAMINRMLAAIRWWARRTVHITIATEHMPPTRMVQTLSEALQVANMKYVTRSFSQSHPRLTAQQGERLLATCRSDPRPAGRRDLALFTLAMVERLRPGKLRALRRGDLSATEGSTYRLSFPYSRVMPAAELVLSSGIAQVVEAWLEIRDERLPAAKLEIPLFLAINKGGRILPNGLSGEALRQILRKRQAQAGLNTFTWNSLLDWPRVAVIS